MEKEETDIGNRRRFIATIAIALAAIAIVVGAAVVLSDDDDGAQISTEESTEPTPTTAPSTAPTTAATMSRDEASAIVWPSPGGSTRFDDPVVVAEDFAVELVGFETPTVGEFRQGDSRSGEVVIRPRADGPETTVLVRQMSDGHWWVISATTESIELDDPIAGTAIDDPLVLSGRARAFEGTVQVAVFERGDTTPLGEGFVTGSGGEELDPFTDEIRWNNPGGGWGTVVLYTASGENGQVWEAVAVPVGFIGGD